MSYFTPEQFDCLQGECPLSCCCGWRIGIDEATEQRWRDTDIKVSERWFAALECRGEKEYQVCLLGQDEQACCKLMDVDGLCVPHKSRGIEYKPETCRRFPLIELPLSSTQQSLSLACPEVGRILLDADFRAETNAPAWRHFSQLRDFTHGLFVDWHEVDVQAADKLYHLVSSSISDAIWRVNSIEEVIIVKQPSDLASVCASLGDAQKNILLRYFYQSALHLGLPELPYAGDAIASVSQLTVLLLAMTQVLAHYQAQGVVMDSADAGLVIAHIERQWGHPSSGLELLRLHPWMAQLDWAESTLDLLVEHLDD